MRTIPRDLRLVFWETTAACNLACIHCRRMEVARASMRDDLTTAEARAMIDAVREVAAPILVLSGGEPLMRPDIFEIAAYAVEGGLTVSLATNGTLIDDDVAARIAAAGIRRVAVSIDGSDARTHDEFRRQPGSLEAALAGARRVRRHGVGLQINCTITRHNVHQLDELYRLAVELGADALHIFMLVPVGCGASIADTHMLSAPEYEGVLEWAFRRAQEGPLHVKPTCAPHYFRVRLQRGRRPSPSSGHPFHALSRGCLAGSGVIFISHRGEVFPCGYLPLSCGSVRRQRFAEIWESSPVLEALRDPDRLKGKCGRCEYRRICLGCRARAFYATGDFLEEEPFCVYQPLRGMVFPKEVS